MKLLLDTSALLALVWTTDRNHPAARDFVAKNPSVRWVVSDLLVAEVATRVRARSSAEQAVQVTRSVLASADVVFADQDLLDAALTTLGRFSDKKLSLPDCLSFVIVARLGLAGAFTFDRDFRDCGVTSFP